ncbi:ankyrin repeat-containing protein ITN1 isoform X2 [Beta vulgaris subsp. vulgaris]|uniref:ankyrin repeat-containing protein ITN1 isoform X2 n=1 Tax=Beta vulgaris subsp. vulgaris TaxID=3555 RepID=UPI00203676A4|nr:ankyrin repeat-containing protein ITN1 isoform X2 [Beta vulgaris subsp. vulgaris]
MKHHILDVDDPNFHIRTKLNEALSHPKKEDPNIRREKNEILKDICKTIDVGPLISCNIHNCSVLHLACYFQNFDLATDLLNSMDESTLALLWDTRNAWGSTVLHDAATSKHPKGLEFVKLLLQKVPYLLLQHDNMGESAVFQAIRYDMALDIASRYPDLCDKPTKQQTTALQMLSISPKALKSGVKLGCLAEFVYNIVSTGEEEQGTHGEVGVMKKAVGIIVNSSCCEFPMIEKVREMKRGNDDALKLARILIQRDTSWQHTYLPRASITPITNPHNSVQPLNSVQTSIDISDDHCWGETPLLMAARTGCIEVVRLILEKYPEAVDHLNENQENVLHVAVKNRNMEVFDLVREKRPSTSRGLIRAVNKQDNSILHLVSCKPADLGEFADDREMKSPAVQLSEDLALLENLEDICPEFLQNHRNDQKLTGRELFAKTNAKLHEEAKTWLKSTAENCTVVIILMITVAFAAAYTVPGGPDDKTGLPILLGKPLFILFTVTDVLSLGFGLTAVVVFLTILTSPYRMKDFRRSLPQKLLLGFTLLFFSVSMMMIAFAATIVLTINARQRWTKIALYIVAVFPVVIFMLSYIPFYKELITVLSYWLKKIHSSLPRLSCRASEHADRISSKSH